FKCDWSSDVCSSDLALSYSPLDRVVRRAVCCTQTDRGGHHEQQRPDERLLPPHPRDPLHAPHRADRPGQLGRLPRRPHRRPRGARLRRHHPDRQPDDRSRRRLARQAGHHQPDQLMITIDTVRVGRKWNGRKLYRVTLDSRVGTVVFHNQTRRETWHTLRDLAVKLIVEDRPYKITGIKVL